MKRILISVLMGILSLTNAMADDYSMVIVDRDGNTHTISVSDLDSVYFSRDSFPESTNILNESSNPGGEMAPPSDVQNWYKGKKLLVIGDSQSAFPTDSWQEYCATKLGMSWRTHAKDGIGIIPMVDGDGSGPLPPGANPDEIDTNNTLYALDTVDVRDVDVIVLMGFYNLRFLCTEENHGGEVTDIYPWHSSFKGRLNYALKKVFDLLYAVRNWECKVVLVSPHFYGKYPWNDMSAKDDGEYITSAIKDVAAYQHLQFIDLMHSGVVTAETWNTYQNESTPYSRYYVPYDGVNDGTNKPFPSLAEAPTGSSYRGKFITIEGEEGCYFYNGQWYPATYPCIWNADQLHLNKAGRKVVGEYIADQLLKMKW